MSEIHGFFKTRILNLGFHINNNLKHSILVHLHDHVWMHVAMWFHDHRVCLWPYWSIKCHRWWKQKSQSNVGQTYSGSGSSRELWWAVQLNLICSCWVTGILFQQNNIIPCVNLVLFEFYWSLVLFVFNLYIHCGLQFCKNGKHSFFCLYKKNLFNKWHWENWIATFKTLKLDSYFRPYAKMNSKWSRDLNLMAKTIKLLERSIGEKLQGTGFGNDSWTWHQKHRQNKRKLDKLDIKVKTFCASKDTTNKVKI